MENPLIPMGAITGNPSREFIAGILRQWREVGVTQFMIYPRSGCEIEYMSERWLEVCEWVCIEAEKMGFTSIWLYDEFNWPSGTCLRRVFADRPEFAINEFCVFRENDGYRFELKKGSQMSDLFNPAAVDRFIELTHVRYEQRLGRFMGGLIKGFFTDEPDVGFFRDHYDGLLLRLPYYQGLEEEYRAKTGGGLRDDIERALQTGTNFYEGPCNELIAARFKESYADRISEWCRARGMVLTGHLMNEYSSSHALACNGHPLPVLSGFSLPGMDEIFTHRELGTIEWLTLGTAMYAVEKQGNRGGLAELFALGPCDMTLNRMRKQFWLCAAFGISKYTLAVSQLTMKGNIDKPIYFNPLTPTQAWFPAMKELGEEAAKATGFACKKRICTVGVRYPYTPQPLTDLLKHLTGDQYSWSLLMPDEESDAELILSLKNGCVVEERSGKVFFDYGLLADLLANRPERTTVNELSGELSRDIFLRIYEDGSALVINLAAADRTLKFQGTVFHLPADGVKVFEEAPKTDYCPPIYSPAVFSERQIILDSPNTMRADFTDDICNFSLAESLKGLTLAVRNFGGEIRLSLDGVEIEVAGECTGLPQGFREIYLESAPFSLARGPHCLKLLTDSKDYPYLPTTFLLGKFGRNNDNILMPRRELYGYSGQIIQTGRIVIPAEAKGVMADTGGLCAEIRLDGVSLGKCLWAPFEWELPKGTAGREVTLEIVRYTSCGQIFGSKAFGAPGTGWLNDYSPDNERPIPYFCEIHWIN